MSVREALMMNTADAASAAAMADAIFHGYSFNPTTRACHTFNADELAVELADPAVFSWVDLEAHDSRALEALLRGWNIGNGFTEHVSAEEVLARIAERPDCLAFYLYEIADPEQHLDTSRKLAPIGFERVILVLGPDFVVTFHRGPIAASAHVRECCIDAFKLAGQTPGFIAFLFLERCVYDYAHLNLANDNFLDVIEEKLFTGADAAAHEGIAVAGRNILTLKKLAASLHIVLMLLATKRSAFVSEEARASFHNLLQNAASVRSAIDSSRDMLDGILANLQVAAANRMGDIARMLTVISGILLPMTLITGIYGMNFKFMPELEWQYGYFLVLGGLTALGGGLYLLFRRLGWVSSKLH